MKDAAEAPPEQTAAASIEGSPFSARLTHRLVLEFGDRRDFDDPRHEWRRLFSELLGAFLLVLVAAGGGILVGEGQISLAAAVVAPGLMVMAIILFMGAISGAHLKPVVSLAFALRGDFPSKRVSGYIIVQLVAATLACSFGPALVSGDFTGYWVSVAGPIAGALIAVGCAYVLRGAGGDPISKAAGSGVLTNGSLAEKQRQSGEIERGDVVPPGIADEADRWL